MKTLYFTHNFLKKCSAKYRASVLGYWLVKDKTIFLSENACGASYSEYKGGVSPFTIREIPG